MRLEESVSMTKCHRDSGLLAIANEDFSITLVDIDTMNVVRKFDGHTGKINDIDFDSQSRYDLVEVIFVWFIYVFKLYFFKIFNTACYCPLHEHLSVCHSNNTKHMHDECRGESSQHLILRIFHI